MGTALDVFDLRWIFLNLVSNMPALDLYHVILGREYNGLSLRLRGICV